MHFEPCICFFVSPNSNLSSRSDTLPTHQNSELLQLTCESEVANFDLQVRRLLHEDVLGLQVQVDQARPVDLANCQDQLGEDLDGANAVLDEVALPAARNDPLRERRPMLPRKELHLDQQADRVRRRSRHASHLRSELKKRIEPPSNFERLVLGCIEADFCK